MTEDDFDQGPYKVGKMEGDLRRYYRNRPTALNWANEAAKRWPERVLSVTAQFEPDHGFVAVLLVKGAFPEAHDMGYEVQDLQVPVATKTPENWAAPKKAAPRAASGGGGVKRTDGSQRPTRPGKTFRAWEIFDSMPDASRADRIAAGVAEGLNKNMLGTQHSRWAKEQKTS